MTKLLIVDDEEIICEGIRTTIPWENVGIEIVGQAHNGETALQLIRDTKPHIVITDIRMPKMDGIQLAEILHREMPDIKVVLLSGFSDFSYAQQAIRFGVTEYLTKPPEADELLALMVRIKEKMEKRIDALYFKIHNKEAFEKELAQYMAALLKKDSQTARVLLENLLNGEYLGNISLSTRKELCVEIVERTFLTLRDNGVISSFQFQEECRLALREMYSLPLREDLSVWLHEFTSSIVARLLAAKLGEPSLAVRKAISYLTEHYAENLSVQRLAAEVGLNANYFSHIFKKYTGRAFTDYLNNLRVQQAKELLSHHRIGEVAELVGFSDYKYFSGIFKKIEGVSPSIYVKTFQNN